MGAEWLDGILVIVKIILCGKKLFVTGNKHIS